MTDLATRFRLFEHYDKSQPNSQPGRIGQYRVLARHTIKIATEKPQGTPDRTEATQETDYRERPADVGSDDKIRAEVRSYNSYRITPNPKPTAKPLHVEPLKGLTIWYQPREGNDPLILSLVDKRSLREDEYSIIRSEVYLPDLASLLPPVPTRVGDRWNVSKAGARALLGTTAVPLAGILQQVRKAAEGTDWEAVIGISGRLPARAASGTMAVNARLVFRFLAPTAEGPEANKEAPPASEKVIEGHGAIVEVRMATSETKPLPPSGRLRQMVNRELIVERRLNEPGEVLAIPDTPPEVTEANSWLKYDEPQGKFHFRYPQDFHLGRTPDEMSIELVRNRPNGPDILELQRILKTGDAEADRLNRDPEFHLKTLKEEWRQKRLTVIPGPHAWLPEADWAAAKRRVYRAESVLKGSSPAGKGRGELRVHNDLYFVAFGRDESLIVTSSTVQDPATAFRQQVEAIIRTFDFGPSDAPR